MDHKNAVVAVFGSHTDAETAVKQLHGAQFDMKQISIIAKNYQTDEHVVGFYNNGDRMMTWGKLGAFWGGLWGLLFGAGLFVIPGIGPVLVAGHLITYIVAGLEGAVIYGGLSALGAGLYGLGIPKDSILQYETAIKGDKFVLVVHGTTAEAIRAKQILEQIGADNKVDSYELTDRQAISVG